MWWILAAAAAVALWYWLFIYPHKYWLKRGVKPRTSGFLLGDTLGTFLQKQAFADMVKEVYETCPNPRWVTLVYNYHSRKM